MVNFYVTKGLTGHDCFNAYLNWFKHKIEESCDYYKHALDDANHVLFDCSSWSEPR